MEVGIQNTKLRKRDLRKLKTAWLESGNPNGPILLFLHGFPDSPKTWKEQTLFFQEKYLLLCPYTRGAKESDGSHQLKRYSIKAESLDLLQILDSVDKTKSRPLFLIGHDLGGALAWEVSPLLGPRLKGLVVVNSLSLSQMTQRLKQRPKQWMKSWYFAPLLVPYFPEFAFSHFGKPLLNYIHFSGGFPEVPMPANEYCREYIVGPLNQYRAYAKDMLLSVFEKPTKLSAPVLVVWSNEDKYLLHPKLSEIEPYANKPEIKVLPGKHWIHSESPEVFNSVLNEFLERCLP